MEKVSQRTSLPVVDMVATMPLKTTFSSTLDFEMKRPPSFLEHILW